jgi:hypothetical protein
MLNLKVMDDKSLKISVTDCQGFRDEIIELDRQTFLTDEVRLQSILGSDACGMTGGWLGNGWDFVRWELFRPYYEATWLVLTRDLKIEDDGTEKLIIGSIVWAWDNPARSPIDELCRKGVIILPPYKVQRSVSWK